MKTQVLTIENLNDFEELAIENQKTVKGGTGDPNWYSIFDFDNNPHLSDPQIEFIKDQIDHIGSTDYGKEFLDSLYSSFSQNNETINIETAGPSGSNVYAQYDLGSNTLILGKYFEYTDADGASAAYTMLAHELYHSFEDIKGESTTGIKSEVDAYLFSALAAKEYDEKNGTNYYDIQVDSQLRGLTENTQAHDAFVKAFKDIVENGNFTLDNYNALINNMKEGFAPAVASENTQKLVVNPVSDLTSTSIDEMFAKFNPPSPDSPNDGDYDNGSGGSNYWDDYDDYDPEYDSEPSYDYDPWDNSWDDWDNSDDNDNDLPEGSASIDDDFDPNDPWDYSDYC